MSLRRIVASLVTLAVVALLAFAVFRAGSRRETARVDFIMDTVVELRLFGRDAETAADEIMEALRETERRTSLFDSGSEISRLNAAAGKNPVPLSDETFRLLETALEFCAESGGRFDITIAPVKLLWDFGGDGTVPDPEKLSAAASLVDFRDLLLDPAEQTAMLRRDGQAVDLGGVAKGAADRAIREIAEKYSVKSGYVSIGGTIVVIGKKPDGSDFRFGVRDPEGAAQDIIGTVRLPGRTIATSGGYERYFERDGTRYHHILDPETGLPAESDLLSATVIAECGARADYLSTFLFIAGLENALPYLEDDSIGVILVTRDGTVYSSENLARSFIPEETENYYTFNKADRNHAKT